MITMLSSLLLQSTLGTSLFALASSSSPVVLLEGTIDSVVEINSKTYISTSEDETQYTNCTPFHHDGTDYIEINRSAENGELLVEIAELFLDNRRDIRVRTEDAQPTCRVDYFAIRP